MYFSKFIFIFLYYLNFSQGIVNYENKILDIISKIKKDPDYFDNTFNSPDSDFIEMINVESYLSILKDKCHGIINETTIGNSVNQNPLKTLILSDNPNVHEPGEPEMKFVASMHGDEIVGKYLILNFINFLCKNYHEKTEIKAIIDNTRLHFLISMNPDSNGVLDETGKVLEKPKRGNAKGVDLNRNFPSVFNKPTLIRLQPETKSVMSWIENNDFILSINFHGGAYVISYPFDDSRDESASAHKTVDDTMIRDFALVYSQLNPKIHNNEKCIDEDNFPDGIINGMEWYRIQGSMSDWDFINSNSMEIVAEIGCQKFPMIKDMMRYWNENKNSVLATISFIQRALKGFIIDGPSGHALTDATIVFHDKFKSYKVKGSFGDYWKFLPKSGKFKFHVTKKNYQDSEVFEVDGSKLPFVDFTQGNSLNITLWPSNYPSEQYSIVKANLDQDFTDPRQYLSIMTELAKTYSNQPFMFYKYDVANIFEVRHNDASFVVEKKIIEITNLDEMKPVTGRIRVVMAYGTPCPDIYSTEMAFRTIRHVIETLHRNSVSRDEDFLDRIQLFIIPYLNEHLSDLEDRFTLSKTKDTLSNYTSINCKVSDKVDNFFNTLLATLEPHIFLSLNDNDYSSDEQQMQIYYPGPNSKSPSSLFEFLVWRRTMGNIIKSFSGFLIPKRAAHQNEFVHQICQGTGTDDLERRKVVNKFVQSIETTTEELRRKKSIRVFYATASITCLGSHRIFNYNHLPWLWVRYLDSFNFLINTFHSHSFCGQILGQINIRPVTEELQITDFAPVSNASITIKPVHRQYPGHGISIDEKTGLFCDFLAEDDYILSVNGSPNRKYLNASVPIDDKQTYYASHSRLAISHQWILRQEVIYLLFSLPQIEYKTPDDLMNQIKKYEQTHSTEPTEESCAKARIIGKSKNNRPIYAVDILPKKSKDSKSNNVTFKHHTLLLGNYDQRSDFVTPSLLIYLVDYICQYSKSVLEKNDKLLKLHNLNMTIIPVPNPDELYNAWNVAETSMRDEMTEAIVCEKNKQVYGDRIDFWKKIMDIEMRANEIQKINGSFEVSFNEKLKMLKDYPELDAVSKEVLQNPVHSAIIFSPSTNTTVKLSDVLQNTLYGRSISQKLNQKLRNISELYSPIFHSSPKECRGIDENSVKYRDLNNYVSTFLQSERKLNHHMYSDSYAMSSLKIHSPNVAQISLCPGCQIPTGKSIAKLWMSSDLSGLIVNIFDMLLPIDKSFNGIIGRVVDENDKPIKEGRVHIDFLDHEWIVREDLDNSTFFISLTPGLYRVTVRSLDIYQSAVKILNLTKDETQVTVFNLKKIPVSILPEDKLSRNIFVIGTTILVMLFAISLLLLIRLCRISKSTYAMSSFKGQTLPLEETLMPKKKYTQIATSDAGYIDDDTRLSPTIPHEASGMEENDDCLVDFTKPDPSLVDSNSTWKYRSLQRYKNHDKSATRDERCGLLGTEDEENLTEIEL